ncbi:hypothetical protein OIE49_17440 [Streptomyces sp. NBC_01788]|uniref:hypothetical protein n=1 Tax=Streptomyces sp. NBC_01788 TaxID=2975940 RepID=UPI002DDBB63E|nr:hypothetical protein [Streptomyces sp. NBC_01788]WSB27534.1 hypothetical protein OIE49_17440 [Streptomyces sp. NBC_01788]
MTKRTATGWSRSLTASAAGLACCLLLVGCEGKSDAAEPGGVAPVTQELSLLVSAQNGMYYPPFLRDEPAGPENNSYAVRLKTSLGPKPQLGLSAKSGAFFRQEAIGTSPLWGRSWLAPLASAGAADLLTASDAAALRRMRTGQGWFSEPGNEHPDDGPYRAAATAAALEALAASGGITEDDRTLTLPWLRQAAKKTGDSLALSEAADLARGFRLLGASVPQALMAVREPSISDFTALGEKERYQALLDAYNYAVLSQAAGVPSKLDAKLWAKLVQHNAASLDYRDLYYAVTVAQAAGAPSDSYAAVRNRITADTLPDGTIRDSTAYAGSPEASVYGLRLRALAGESTRDSTQAAALRKIAADPQISADPHVRLTTAAALKLASGAEPTAADSALCHSAEAVPTAVSPENAEAWSRAALACADMGVGTPQPQAAAWSLDDPAKVTAAATVVTTLSDTGRSGSVPQWVTAAELRSWAANPERLPSVSAYATVVRAYLIVGGTMDSEIREAIDRGMEAHRGCAQLPSLYRADASQSGCDLKATWSAWKLTLLRGGQLHARTTPSGEPSKK